MQTKVIIYNYPYIFIQLTLSSYTLDEEKIECALGTRDIWFLAGQESRECCIIISDVGIRGIYLSDSWYCQIQTTILMLFGFKVGQAS